MKSMLFKTIRSFAAWGFLAFAPAAVMAAAAQTYERELPNGLRIIVKEDHRAPTIVSMVWYKAGSMDEFNGTTGVAHVLEHMMFKGTKSVPNGEFSRLVAAAGGRENAFTTQDATGYHQQLHKQHLALAFRLEADRMANLVLDKEEFAKEMKVVMEERRWRTDDRPQGLLYEQFMATALKAHPYRVPVIGWMKDLENMTYLDAQQWYREWYAPNNAIVVVVGDVAAQDVFALAAKYFGGLKARKLPERKAQEEPVQLGLRTVTVKAPAELPALLMGYRVPILKSPEQDWEPYALEMLGGILSGNDAARLPSALVRRDRIALSAAASYENTQRGPGLFMIRATPSPGKTPNEVEQAVRRELAKIAAEGVTEEELKRIKAQVVAAQVFQRDSIYFQAMQIGSLESSGYSHKAIDLMLSKLRDVTAQQVQQVAKTYFFDDALTVGVLDPQPLDGRKPVAPPEGLHDAR